jgi:hypothetical protein
MRAVILAMLGVACLSVNLQALQPVVTREYKDEVEEARKGLVEIRQILRCGGSVRPAHGRGYIIFSLANADYLATALHAVLPKHDRVAAGVLEDVCSFSLELRNTDSPPDKPPLTLSKEELLGGLLVRDGLIKSLGGIPYYQSDPGENDIVLLRLPKGKLFAPDKAFVPVQCGQESPRQLEGVGLVTWIAGPSDRVIATDVNLTDVDYWEAGRPIKEGDSGSPVFVTLREGCRRALAFVGVVSWAPSIDGLGRKLDQSETFRAARISVLWDLIVEDTKLRHHDKDPALLKLAFVAHVAQRVLQSYRTKEVGVLQPGEIDLAVRVARDVLSGRRYCECEDTAQRLSFLEVFLALNSLEAQPSFRSNATETARRVWQFVDFRSPSRYRSSVAQYEAEALVESAKAYYAGYSSEGMAMLWGIRPELRRFASELGSELESLGASTSDSSKTGEEIPLADDAVSFLVQEYRDELRRKDKLLLHELDEKLGNESLYGREVMWQKEKKQ